MAINAEAIGVNIEAGSKAEGCENAQSGPTTPGMSEAERQDEVKRSYKFGDVDSLVKYHEVIDLDDVQDHGEEAAGLGGDYIKSFVFGGLDGIVSTFALVAGLGGAEVKLKTLIAVGLAKVVADAFSMGFGEFTSATAELENALIVRRREEWETENFLEGEVKEMAKLYMDKGVSKQDALTMLTVMSKYTDLFVEHMMVVEHGILPPDDEDRWAPVKQGLVCFIAFVLFGMIPLFGFIIVYLIDPNAANSENDVGRVIGIAYGLTALTLCVMGVTKAKLTGSPKFVRSGVMMVANGTIAGGIAYLVGETFASIF